MMNLEIIIGLEVHIELNTKSKLFCSCSVADEASPNTSICPVCTGHPGVLPVLNQEAVKKILLLGLAFNGQISKISCFDRKNYFYPDLPKAYQISQFPLPFIQGGTVEIETMEDNKTYRKFIQLERIHLEEDAAKLLHGDNEIDSFVDFNRSSVPLAELVTKPDLRSPFEAKCFLENLRLIARYLNISEAEMQKGQMRCDANISLRPLGDEKYYPKTEIKNLNSFKAVEDALNYEIERQTDLWEKGEVNSTTSTRGWDEKRGVTILQREKEESHDYRYFPEPDLPIVESATLPFQIDDLKKELAELPLAKQDRWIRDYQILKSEAKILSSNKSLADYADQILSNAQKWPEENREKGAKLSINWLINRFWPLVDQADPRKTFEKISAQKFYNFINLLLRNSFSSTVAQKILEETVMTGEEPELIMKRSGLDESLDDAGLDDLISKITQQNAKVVEDYHKGKESALQFLVGQIMRETRGRVNPQKALLRLKELIK